MHIFHHPPSFLMQAQAYSFVGALPLVHIPEFNITHWFRLTHHKHWLYFCISTKEIFLAAAVIDLSYAVQAFVFAYDLKQQKLLIDVSHLSPPGFGGVSENVAGRRAWFDFFGLSLSILSSPPGTPKEYFVHIKNQYFHMHAKLDEKNTPSPVCAWNDQNPPFFHATEKTNLLSVQGEATCQGRTYSFAQGLAGIDYTEGYLPRQMDWQWAFALGTTADHKLIGFNLVNGALEAAECALWLDQEVIPLEKAKFQFSPQEPLLPWTIETLDASLCLTFHPFSPKGFHAEKKNLVFIASRYLQVMGSFQGEIRLPHRSVIQIDNVVGVTEDQHVLW